ncbi:unnamed protein product [Caenorhabditis auriculariae]|uniref:Uncharacterized protein n=1 Tax=Caenorhabditis auriculariae TaxID=2777116 RepID=A0A8S1H7M8_9PELO|nr:unnamed protein product [Caenorhabditis auriculariae]
MELGGPSPGLKPPTKDLASVSAVLQRAVKPEVKASGSDSAASLLWLETPPQTSTAGCGDRDRNVYPAPETPGPAAALTLPDKTKVSGSMPPSEYDVVRRPSRHITRPETLPISPSDFFPL